MKNATILQAIEIGFDLDQFENTDTLQDVMDNLVDFMHENLEKLPTIEEECEVDGVGQMQSVTFGNYQCSGEIVDFSANWHKSPETKVFHSNYADMNEDGTFVNVKLYYLVGETDYNAPNGYTFDRKTKKHIKEESKVVIKDSLTNEFYCVPMTEKDYYGEPTTGENDFPFWSEDESEANVFISENLAKHEMKMNDLTEDGTRNPIIEVI